MKISAFKLLLIAVVCGLGLAALPFLVNAVPNAPRTGSQDYNRADNSGLQDVAFRPSRVRRELRRDGWRSIVFVDDKLPVYIVRACRDGRRFELRLDRFAEIRRRRDLGPCQTVTDNRGGSGRLSVRDIRRVLVGLDYESIEFRDRELPVYVADACKNRIRYRMRINRRGDINFRERIGRCSRDGRLVEDRSLSVGQVRRLIERLGFNRVRFTDRNLPTYVARACKNNREFELEFNGQGNLRRRSAVGRCAEAEGKGLSVRAVRNILRKRHYYRMRFSDRELPWYRLTACRSRKQYSLLINRWGDVRRRRQIGVCEAPQFGEVTQVRRRRLDLEELRNVRRIDGDECEIYLEGLLEDNTINFAVASAKIEEESYDLLERLAFVASRCPETTVEIAGHTDSDGSRKNNQKLSERRAQSVVTFLNNREVPREQLTAVGYGEDRPIASNRTDSGKARNRRIEFVVNWGS